MKRALWIAHRLSGDAYPAGWNLDSKLLDLYNHRSDCVHGKVPFEELIEAGEVGKLEVAECLWLSFRERMLQYGFSAVTPARV